MLLFPEPKASEFITTRTWSSYIYFQNLKFLNLLWLEPEASRFLFINTRTCSSEFTFSHFIFTQFTFSHFIYFYAIWSPIQNLSKTWSSWIYLSLSEHEASGFIYLQIFLYISEGFNSSDFCQTRSSDSDCDFRITRSCNNVKACKFEICCTRSVWGQLQVLGYWCQITPKIRRPILHYWK